MAANLSRCQCINELGHHWFRRKAIIQTNAEVSLIGKLGTNLSEISIEIRMFSFKIIYFKPVWAMTAILSRCQCINELDHPWFR